MKELNSERRRKAGKLVGESYNINELKENPSLAVGYIVAPPRMEHYMDCSPRIDQVYLKHVAPEDIHVYSIDEVVKAFFPEVPLIVDANGCAGVSPESHQRALEAMKVCQIKVIND